jgi:hypothetical protein
MSLPLEIGPTCQWDRYLLSTVYLQRSNPIFDFLLISLLSYLRSNWKSLGQIQLQQQSRILFPSPLSALALVMQVTNPTASTQQ